MTPSPSDTVQAVRQGWRGDGSHRVLRPSWRRLQTVPWTLQPPHPAPGPGGLSGQEDPSPKAGGGMSVT